MPAGGIGESFHNRTSPDSRKYRFHVYSRPFGTQRERVAMANKSKRDAVISNRKDLAEHVETFLKAGGKVQQIPSGVSGQTSTSGPRQIVLSHKTS